MTRFGFVGQADLFQHLVDARLERLARQAVHLAPEREVFPGGQVIVEGQVLRHHADDLPDGHRLLGHRMPADRASPLVGA